MDDPHLDHPNLDHPVLDHPVLDHRAFVAGLEPGVKAALTARSDAPGLRHLGLQGGAIAVCGTWIALGLPLWWASLPVQGVLIVFFYAGA